MTTDYVKMYLLWEETTMIGADDVPALALREHTLLDTGV